MLSKLFIGFLLMSALYSCKESKQHKEEQTPSVPVSASIKRPLQAYVVFADSVQKELKKLQAKKELPRISLLIYNVIYSSMPLYWHGTRWDFNGTTRTPGDSTIACGYFITTVLDDIGLKVNRTWLAQQPSSVLIKATCNEIKTFAALDDLEKYLIKTPPSSVLIIGLDFHTGFIIKDKKSNNYFFHSNYIGRAGVTKELISESKTLKASKSFMIGMLSRNESYIIK